MPLVPVAGSVISDTKLLTWASYSPIMFSNGPGNITVTAVTDLTTLTTTVINVTNTQHDMFCPGISALSDGRIMVTGGNYNYKTSIFDPAASNWTVGPRMNIGRGYQATATMSDGRVFVIGGSWSGGTGGKNGEVWSASTGWRKVSGCAVAPMNTTDTDVTKQDTHAWLFGWKNATIFQAGPSHAMNWYYPDGNTTVPAGPRGTSPNSICGNAVLYDAVAGKILTLGGSLNYGGAGNVASNQANIVTIPAYGGFASVQPVSPMDYNRSYANSVILADGKIIVLGGQSQPIQFTDGNAVYNAELWDPSTQQFTVMAAAAVPRTYHSIGLLLPDARVFNGGGGLNGPSCGCNHEDGQIYTPPYLLNSDGTDAVRPTLTATSRTVAVGGTITATANDTVSVFSLIRRGTVTHAVDTDQRRIALAPGNATVNGGMNTYSLAVPADPGIALPGYWYLFAVNAAGVPSISWTMLVTLP